MWDVVLNEEAAKDYHCREQEDSVVWRKVRCVPKTEPYDGYVFNIEVEGDNSYVAEGIGVHNCVGFGTAQALETTLTRRYGVKHYVPLAGMDVYSWIGRTISSGAYIPDGMSHVSNYGCLPLDTSENRERYDVVRGRLDYTRNRGPDGWQDVAKLFRVTQWAKCYGEDEIASALLCGFCGTVGRSRHCVPYCRLVHNGGKFYAGYANSWSGDWGDGGWGYDSERVFDGLTMYVILDVEARPDLDIPTTG